MIKTPTTSDSAPLEGCRVIDFGHYFAGPLAGMLLADQGAEVVKIDRPGQKQTPLPLDTVFNRGKQRLQLDLKTPDDLENAKQLVKSAGVAIATGYRDPLQTEINHNKGDPNDRKTDRQSCNHHRRQQRNGCRHGGIIRVRRCPGGDCSAR